MGVQVEGFSRHTGIYKSCRLGCVINEELLEEEATNLLTDTQTTMLLTAMFNRRSKPEKLQLILHNRKHTARKREGAGMVMTLFMYCRILQRRKYWMIKSGAFPTASDKQTLDYTRMTYWS